MSILTIILAVLALSLMIFLHELGHFMAGRKLGFTILEFSIGMGPKIFSREVKGVTYSLRLFLIGGSCRFYGEDQEVADERCFSAHKPWKKAIVLLAGAAMNLLTALLVAFALLWGYGELDSSKIIVQSVNDSSPAQVAGIEKGDQFYSVDGTLVDSFATMSAVLNEAGSEPADVVVLRDGEQVETQLSCKYDEESGRYLMGVNITYGYVRCYNFFEAIGAAVKLCCQVVAEVYMALWGLITGQYSLNDMGGVVLITQLIGDSIKSGFPDFLRIVVLLSANLGVMNLLPLPALDGGRLVFVVLEGIFKKPVASAKTEAIIHAVGMMLLFALMIYITVHDVVRCYGG
ncbi:MAG TPA: M50 family metallopeptidase [Eubacteriales bacterium]|nr:M50 family metallopeptidase [Clostridia bacterium]HRV73718.1 M50 family metallopeptidase [Eubacteriales bacterium]